MNPPAPTAADVLASAPPQPQSLLNTVLPESRRVYVGADPLRQKMAAMASDGERMANPEELEQLAEATENKQKSEAVEMFRSSETLWHQKARMIEEGSVDLSALTDEDLNVLISQVIALDAGSDRSGFVFNTFKSIKSNAQYNRLVELYLKALEGQRAEKEWVDSEAFTLGFVYSTAEQAYLKIDETNVKVLESVEMMLADRIKDLDVSRVYPGKSENAKNLYKEVFALLLNESTFTISDLISFIGFGLRNTPNSLYLMTTATPDSKPADPELFLTGLLNGQSSAFNKISSLFVVVCSIYKMSLIDGKKAEAKSLFERLPEAYNFIKGNRKLVARLEIA